MSEFCDLPIRPPTLSAEPEMFKEELHFSTELFEVNKPQIPPTSCDPEAEPSKALQLIILLLSEKPTIPPTDLLEALIIP